LKNSLNLEFSCFSSNALYSFSIISFCFFSEMTSGKSSDFIWPTFCKEVKKFLGFISMYSNCNSDLSSSFMDIIGVKLPIYF